MAQKDSFERPGLDQYAVILPVYRRDWNVEKSSIETKTPIDENTNEPIKHYSSSFNIVDPDRIKIQFLYRWVIWQLSKSRRRFILLKLLDG